MHEWSVAESVIRTLVQWSSKNRVIEIKKVVISVPSFSMLDVDVLREAFDMMKGEYSFSGTLLEINIKEPVFKCENCDSTFSVNDVGDQIEKIKLNFGEEYPLHLMPALVPAFLVCPYCGSHDIEVSSQSITIDKIEVEKS
ncbi:MAG: hydrogenase maturation nickel metallochaperone HypA [Thermoprotei archaeon]